MSNINPGEEIKKINIAGKLISLRIPSIGDLNGLHKYVNDLSKENTYVIFSGEEISLLDEKKYLEEVIARMNDQDFLGVIAVCDDKIIAYTSLTRKIDTGVRRRHIAEFGISVAKEYRGLGLGFKLSSQILELAKIKIPELEMITLSVYSENTIGQNMYKKLGFKEYGRLPEGVWYREKYIDEILMYKKLRNTK